jgi:hypothetical protein
MTQTGLLVSGRQPKSHRLSFFSRPDAAAASRLLSRSRLIHTVNALGELFREINREHRQAKHDA